MTNRTSIGFLGLGHMGASMVVDVPRSCERRACSRAEAQMLDQSMRPRLCTTLSLALMKIPSTCLMQTDVNRRHSQRSP
jgi:hypothetical protein